MVRHNKEGRAAFGKKVALCVDTLCLDPNKLRRSKHQTFAHQYESWGNVRADLIKRTGLARQETGISFPGHIFLMNLRGVANRGEDFVDGRRISFSPRRAGSVIHMPAGSDWTGWDEGDPTAAYLLVSIEKAFADEAFGGMVRQRSGDLPASIGFRDTTVEMALQRIFNELKQPDPISVTMVESQAMQLLVQMVRLNGSHHEPAKGGLSPFDLKRAVAMIESSPDEMPTLTEDLHAKERKHRLLMMLDEFPALGRLDFFESALAFMAGYGIKSFLIAQSLNQIEKAYGANNSILDNCHIRVSFATNDERTAKRVSDALGTATEMKAMRNYAGHRLSPWLGHLMVSRSETARPLLTPGEVMQLPATDEIVMVAGAAPIRAKKARYYEDARFKERVLPQPNPQTPGRTSRTDAWSTLTTQEPDAALMAEMEKAGSDQANSGLRREPELPDHVAIAKETTDQKPAEEFAALLDEEPEDVARQRQALRRQMTGVARQVSLDPNDGMDL